MSSLTIYHGDVLDTLRGLDDNVFHAVITDPPYGLSNNPNMQEVLERWLRGDDYQHKGAGFLGKTWDSFVPGPSVWKEMLRVCRPGAILLAYCGTRTADLMSIAIRLGGWQKIDEIDVYGTVDWLSWIYSSGMAKSFNLSRQFDKRAGKKGEVVSSYNVPDIRNGHGREYGSHFFTHSGRGHVLHEHYAPATEEAEKWFDYGTRLNPAHEVILVYRRECEGTFLDNAEKWGTGVFNIGAARIPTHGKDKEKHLAEWDRTQSKAAEESFAMNEGLKPIDLSQYKKEGRWPKNVIFLEEPDTDTRPLSEDLELQSGFSVSKRHHRGTAINGNIFKSPEYESTIRGHNDEGTAKRFFYVSKAYRSEREFGLGDGNNKHPTIKPIQLNKYIATLVQLPDDSSGNAPKLLVPYSGAGSECIGAFLAGWKDIYGIELEEEYIEIATKRFEFWHKVSLELNTTEVSEILSYDPDRPMQKRLV